jgi:hypothetical protein
MELVLNRHAPIGLALPGELFIDGQHACYTLERVGVAIQEGSFKVLLYNSPHFGQLMPWVQVPDRQYILIHWGNYPVNSDGCILVGETQDPATGDIYNTRKMWGELFPAIEGAVNAEGCWLTIGEPMSNAEDVEAAANGEN